MATPDAAPAPVGQQGSLTAVVRKLGPGFASRAAGYDANDSFVADNFLELKEHKMFSIGVPAELGGGGASHAELCGLLREVGHYCGSTALALSMHTHLVGTLTWMWRQGQPVAPLLERIARDELVLVTTGASDWLESSGNTERIEGGYRVTGRKVFGSGSPMGDLLLTSAPYVDPNGGPMVLHFALPMKSEGLSVLDNWRTMGMRATGSNDIVLDGVFVPDAAVQLRRPKGVWHPFFNVIAAVALPIVLSVYLGVAESARDLALQHVAKKQDRWRYGKWLNSAPTTPSRPKWLRRTPSLFGRPSRQSPYGSPSKRRSRPWAVGGCSGAWGSSGCCATFTLLSFIRSKQSGSIALQGDWRLGSIP